MEIAIIVIAVIALVFGGVALRQVRPTVTAERVAGHPDIFELWNEGPGTAVIVHADVISPQFPNGLPIDDAQQQLPGLSIDARIQRAANEWAKGAELAPMRRFEIRLPSATTLRLVYRGEGILGTMATAKMSVDGGH